jgi:hypothetical protein
LIPHSVLEALIDFVNAHHIDRPFKKRKRKEIRPEEHKFGKEPIFLAGKWGSGSGGNG